MRNFFLRTGSQYIMPAGLRIIYFGVALTNEHLSHFIDMKSFFENGSSEWEYLEHIEDILRYFGHKGELSYISGAVISPRAELASERVAIYGYEIGSYEVFEDTKCLPRKPPKKVAREIYKFIRQTSLDIKPMMYSRYRGD